MARPQGSPRTVTQSDARGSARRCPDAFVPRRSGAHSAGQQRSKLAAPNARVLSAADTIRALVRRTVSIQLELQSSARGPVEVGLRHGAVVSRCALDVGQMNAEHMTPAEEFEFYSRPENLRLQGPARRRSPRLLGRVSERDPDQAWYWTPEWQEGEQQIELDRATGWFGPVFDSAHEFLDALRARAGGFSRALTESAW